MGPASVRELAYADLVPLIRATATSGYHLTAARRASAQRVIACALGDTGGYLFASTSHRSYTVLGIWVAPHLRGQGASRLLIDWLQTQARARGASRIFITLPTCLQQCTAFWKRHGFTQDACDQMSFKL